MKTEAIQVVIVQTDPSILRLIELMLKNEKNLQLTLLTDPWARSPRASGSMRTCW